MEPGALRQIEKGGTRYSYERASACYPSSVMRLSVIVVNWNLRDELAACLDSLRLQTHHDIEVIVVDNASVDGSVRLVQSQYPRP